MVSQLHRETKLHDRSYYPARTHPDWLLLLHRSTKDTRREESEEVPSCWEHLDIIVHFLTCSNDEVRQSHMRDEARDDILEDPTGNAYHYWCMSVNTCWGE